ncbi:hypothetical protein KP806_16105 [Paenibacillus sp. N4]|uniref:ATP-binding protein n=1 Tax=Paenibacillus vietnamensis TaxID=2590547 RepID=UPI001CD0DE3F|nr:ATP-binding protein [Paenibacillus vietnamensis]MCA0756580.1 hypothetical protein [Paenibacillus vietnamensis]
MSMFVKAARNRNKVFLYLIVVVLPLCLFSYTYLQYRMNVVQDVLEEVSSRNTMIHALNIESFMSSTIGRLESLAMMLSYQSEADPAVEELLLATHEKDPRFSGFYWTDVSGEILQSSNPLPQKINLADRDYFQRALLTGKTQVSDAHRGRVTGRYVFSIATPTMDKSGAVKGVLVGSIQLHIMKQSVNQLVGEEVVQLIDDKGEIIFQTPENAPNHRWVATDIQLDAVPWRVNSMIRLDTSQQVVKPFIKMLILFLLLTHAVFMLIQSRMSKRKIARELNQIEADKLKLVGIIAAGTAHEIRNPLTGIKGFITLLSKKYKDEKDQYYFELIQSEVNRINAIVSELLIIGKPGGAAEEAISVGEVLSEMIPLIESEANLYNVELSVQLTSEPVHAVIARDHLKQIVLNLAKNALEAMETQGSLSISLGRTPEHVRIRIKDTGPGMSPEVLRGIFIPFFTRKENGTGLGLSVCKRILDNCGGELLVDSREGAGTEVTIQLPAAGSDPKRLEHAEFGKGE